MSLEITEEQIASGPPEAQAVVRLLMAEIAALRLDVAKLLRDARELRAEDVDLKEVSCRQACVECIFNLRAHTTAMVLDPWKGEVTGQLTPLAWQPLLAADVALDAWTPPRPGSGASSWR